MRIETFERGAMHPVTELSGRLDARITIISVMLEFKNERGVEGEIGSPLRRALR